MTTKKLDAEPILRRLAEIRKAIPFLDQNPPRPSEEGRLRPEGIQPRTAEEFEYAALAEGLESLANELSAAIAAQQAKAIEGALSIFYVAEELARDPEHADLIPQVKRMREAYEEAYGRPIPPKPKR